MDQNPPGKPISAARTGRTDIDRMPDTPNRRAHHHRRAHSETFFRFPDDDDILLDDVVADFDLASLDNIPSLSSTATATAMAVDSSQSDSSSAAKHRLAGPTPPFRSLSVGADFFEGLDFAPGDGGKPPAAQGFRHRQSNSMDGVTSFEGEELSEMLLMDGLMKKAMDPDRLAELALLDPKRAKRILANRQSAARSKERKVRYTHELERKVHTLQSEATTLSAQVTLLQRDTSGLTVENKELKLRLQAMEQQAHLRDALNEALREEVQRLKIATGQVPAANGNSFNGGLPLQFAQPQIFQHFSNNQVRQPQQQLYMSQSTSNNQTQSSQSQPSLLDFD